MIKSSKLLRSAVVGVGYLGTFHAQKHKNNPHVQLVGVCDANVKQAQKVSVELSVAAYSLPEDLLGKVDLVTIAASTQQHYALAKLFLQQGVHVNLEKPIAANFDQAEELVRIAQEKNVKFAVGHIERFNPAFVKSKELIKDPRFIEFRRMTSFRARGADVSVLHDLMIHDLDLLFALDTSGIKNKICFGHKLKMPTIDVASVAIEMNSGLIAHIHSSRMSANPERSMRVVSSDGHYFVNLGALEVEKTFAQSDEQNPMGISKIQLDKADALQLETDSFIDAVRFNQPVAITGQDGLLALKTVVELEREMQG